MSSKKETASRERLQIGPNAKAGQSGTYMAGRRVRSGGAYHHGDLRAAVIAAGLKRLANRTGVTIGLRELPRAVGVSANALRSEAGRVGKGCVSPYRIWWSPVNLQTTNPH